MPLFERHQPSVHFIQKHQISLKSSQSIMYSMYALTEHRTVSYANEMGSDQKVSYIQ